MHEPCSGVTDGYSYEDPFTHLEGRYPQVWMADHHKNLSHQTRRRRLGTPHQRRMVRGVYIQRASSERLTVEAALKRYLAEISPNKRLTSAANEARYAKPLTQHMGKYSLATLSSESSGGATRSRMADQRVAVVAPVVVAGNLPTVMLSWLI